MQIISKGPSLREGLTWAKFLRFIALPFSPSRLNTFMQVNKFEEVSIKRLLEQGLKGVLIDADGTLVSHHARKFNSSVLEHVRIMLENGLKVAIYTNAYEDKNESHIFVPSVTLTRIDIRIFRLGFLVWLPLFGFLRFASFVWLPSFGFLRLPSFV